MQRNAADKLFTKPSSLRLDPANKIVRLAFYPVHKGFVKILCLEVIISYAHCCQDKYIMGRNCLRRFDDLLNLLIQMAGYLIQTFFFNSTFYAVFLTQYINGYITHG